MDANRKKKILFISVSSRVLAVNYILRIYLILNPKIMSSYSYLSSPQDIE